MTEKPFADLHVGDWICDMHYGVEPLMERFEVVAHIRWDEPEPSEDDKKDKFFDGYARHTFFRYLSQFVPHYGNKMLHVLALESFNYMFPTPAGQPVPALHYGYALVCGYCYDGRRSGLVILRDKFTEQEKAIA